MTAVLPVRCLASPACDISPRCCQFAHCTFRKYVRISAASRSPALVNSFAVELVAHYVYVAYLLIRLWEKNNLLSLLHNLGHSSMIEETSHRLLRWFSWGDVVVPNVVQRSPDTRIWVLLVLSSQCRNIRNYLIQCSHFYRISRKPEYNVQSTMGDGCETVVTECLSHFFTLPQPK